MTEVTGERLLIFGKVPEEGRVKTRLEPLLGKPGALRLYRALLQDLTDRVKVGFPDHCHFHHHPAEPGPELLRLGLPLAPQRGDDLGERMAAAFDDWFRAGVDRVVIIGCDSPDLPLSRITEAFSALRSSDVALAPAVDGGYCLIGLRREVPPIFDDIPWGEEGVLRETLRRLSNCESTVHVLEPWYDVDRPEDLRFLTTHLDLLLRGSGEDRCPRTRVVLAALSEES